MKADPCLPVWNLIVYVQRIRFADRTEQDEMAYPYCAHETRLAVHYCSYLKPRLRWCGLRQGTRSPGCGWCGFRFPELDGQTWLLLQQQMGLRAGASCMTGSRPDKIWYRWNYITLINCVNHCLKPLYVSQLNKEHLVYLCIVTGIRQIRPGVVRVVEIEERHQIASHRAAPRTDVVSGEIEAVLKKLNHRGVVKHFRHHDVACRREIAGVRAD